ncbi:hypothetical protein SCFA_330005 [anaerobic digester metagenome]|uniref:Uncharacterized protein n=1 Tax=anaerobic digester metagenome TaxID=1263854 RepID=A0A485M0Y8_9ZZZZ
MQLPFSAWRQLRDQPAHHLQAHRREVVYGACADPGLGKGALDLLFAESIPGIRLRENQRS